MKNKKMYPHNGPPLIAQELLLNREKRTKENVQFVRAWLKGYRENNGRPETVEAYSLV